MQTIGIVLLASIVTHIFFTIAEAIIDDEYKIESQVRDRDACGASRVACSGKLAHGVRRTGHHRRRGARQRAAQIALLHVSSRNACGAACVASSAPSQC